MGVWGSQFIGTGGRGCDMEVWEIWPWHRLTSKASTFGKFEPQMDADEHRWFRKNYEMDRAWTDSAVGFGSFYPDLCSSAVPISREL